MEVCRRRRKIAGRWPEKMAEIVQRRNEEKRPEKQIGCMGSFLQIFDRQHIHAGKRIHSTKRLRHSTSVGASPETVSSGELQEVSQQKNVVVVVVVPASPDDDQSSPAKDENRRRVSPVIAPTSEPEEMTIVGGDDNQSRPPSVVARLMGLERLTSSDQKPPQTVAKPSLPRSASESRVSRDLIRSKYIDGDNFQLKQPNRSQKQCVKRIVRDEGSNGSKSMEDASEDLKSECSRTSSWRSRSFFHSSDVFPEPIQTTVIMHERFNDLSELKQILEVLQLKGLLHSTSRSNRDSHRNFVYDRNLNSDESSIHLKQWRSLSSKLDNHRSVSDSQGTRRYARTTSSPNRIESNLKSCNSIIKTKPLSIEIKRRANESSDSLRRSPIDSPKHTPKATGSVHHSITNRSPRSHKQTESSSIDSPKQTSIKNIVTDDESSSISESIISTPSTTNSERSKWESCRGGRCLLERCDKLLNSIAEMNGATESPPSSATVLPSPVSVLDSGFDKDESCSPSDSIDFKVTTIEENWSPIISPTKSTEHEEEFISDDTDFTYISQILKASPYLYEDPNVFFSIEKQLYNNTESTSNVSKRQRKLVFDVIAEILDRNRLLSPWKTSIESSRTSVKQIWSEFQKIREINIGNDGLLELISAVLKKDLVEIKDWGDYPIEKSEAIMDIERMIFKDLVSEAVGDLVTYSGECMFSRARRRLFF